MTQTNAQRVYIGLTKADAIGRILASAVENIREHSRTLNEVFSQKLRLQSLKSFPKSRDCSTSLMDYMNCRDNTAEV